VSDVSQGPGWWLASDGRWYSPEQAPGFVPEVAAIESPQVQDAGLPPAAPDSPADPAPSSPGYVMSPTGQGSWAPPGAAEHGPPQGISGPPGPAPPVNPGYGFPPPGPGYGYPPVSTTNGLAIASLVCSFFFWLSGIGSVLAIVFGFIARSQIKRSGGAQQGAGLALAGIIIGFAGIVIGIGVIVAIAVAVHQCDQTGNCSFNTLQTGN